MTEENLSADRLHCRWPDVGDLQFPAYCAWLQTSTLAPRLY